MLSGLPCLLELSCELCPAPRTMQGPQIPNCCEIPVTLTDPRLWVLSEMALIASVDILPKVPRRATSQLFGAE